MRLPIFIATAVALATASIPACAADPDAPAYENGTVWDFTEIKTADGHFDDYMQWLSTQWKTQEEALQKAGVIKSYKVLLVTDPREGEGDVMLAIEYPNMAVFDHSVAEQYALQKKIFGSLAQASQQQAARGAIRTIKADFMMREAILK
ncbi:hypothetical protein HZF05_07510 [Sphingomonas sp. CGMCC 1.13654]|uniref:DUF1330 domain-containing protein n=1 Tax=Sphingomonas chungangi TaxID=2683589 RepID=A0A838L5H6_9SPHN|nr:hypothetical protein [Sphingomonas chungangi]MBA2933945.1 hypothetical protein [Sphingomonas chungangi]MVW57072.1 hypothetical protein [Sphingomonas chungangi]